MPGVQLTSCSSLCDDGPWRRCAPQLTKPLKPMKDFHGKREERTSKEKKKRKQQDFNKKKEKEKEKKEKKGKERRKGNMYSSTLQAHD